MPHNGDRSKERVSRTKRRLSSRNHGPKVLLRVVGAGRLLLNVASTEDHADEEVIQKLQRKLTS